MANVPVYPIFLDVKGKPALIVGGGAVGLRKATGLLECGAEVTVVSPVFHEGFAKLRRVERVAAAYATKFMTKEKWRLVFAATDVRAVNARVRKDAAAAGIWCCRCDLPEAGDFSGGAVLRLGQEASVTIATSTRGASPVLGGRICRAAAAGVEPALVVWAELLAAWRKQVKQNVEAGPARQALLLRIAGEEMEELLRRGGAEVAEGAFAQWLAQATGKMGAAKANLEPVRRARKARAVRHAR